ncbi:hypothetical protein U1Q18_038202 [Sarracenia purpurea var. burkii]
MGSSRWCGQCCYGKWVAGFWKLSCSSFLGAGGAPCAVTMVVPLIALLLQVVQASQVKRFLAIPGCSSYHFVVWACTHNLDVALRYVGIPLSVGAFKSKSPTFFLRAFKGLIT